MPASPFETVKGLMPHGMCFSWDPFLLGLHVISDSLIIMSYFSIPLALLYFTKKGGTFPFKYLIGLFSAFIFACGMTHVLSVWTIWRPDYYLEGAVKLLTAGISLVTAFMVWPVVLKVLSLPNLFILQDTNIQLEREIHKRQIIEHELRVQTNGLQEANENLLRLNRQMCGRELRMRELKKEINTLAQSIGRPTPYDLHEEQI
ncbi:MAG TPA: hypothetical protein VLA60_06775 [Nitrospirales bacterium]|nr:hypothetical protein [Nitrospirales bacterium]